LGFIACACPTESASTFSFSGAFTAPAIDSISVGIGVREERSKNSVLKQWESKEAALGPWDSGHRA
jgi:hypothetical protein